MAIMTSSPDRPTPIPETEAELAAYRRRQRTRSVAIGLSLGALVIVFYAATLIRLGPNALKKDSFGGSAKPAAQGTSTDTVKQAPK